MRDNNYLSTCRPVNPFISRQHDLHEYIISLYIVMAHINNLHSSHLATCRPVYLSTCLPVNLSTCRPVFNINRIICLNILYA